MVCGGSYTQSLSRGGGGGGALLSLFLDTEELEEVCGEVSAGVGVDGGARSLD